MPLSRRRGGGPEDESDLVVEEGEEEEEEEEVVEEVQVNNIAPRLSREELEDLVRPTGQMDTIRSSNQVCSALQLL